MSLQHSSELRPPTKNKAHAPIGQGVRGKDKDIGRIVVITTGALKGLRGRIVSATASHVHVELLSRNKKVTVDRQYTKLLDESQLVANRVSSKVQSFEGSASDLTLSVATPSFVAETPKYFGSETPQFGYSETPQSERLDDIWKPNERDYDDNKFDEDAMDTVDMEERSSVYGSSSILKNDIPWREGVVVHIKSRNSFAVVSQIVDATGPVVRMRLYACDSDFRVVSKESIYFSSLDLTIVQPSKKGQEIIVIKGPHAGKTGIFDKSHDGDLLVKIDHNTHFLRPSQVAIYHS